MILLFCCYSCFPAMLQHLCFSVVVGCWCGFVAVICGCCYLSVVVLVAVVSGLGRHVNVGRSRIISCLLWWGVCVCVCCSCLLKLLLLAVVVTFDLRMLTFDLRGGDL